MSKLITSTITATIVGTGFVIATCTQISATKPPQLLRSRGSRHREFERNQIALL